MRPDWVVGALAALGEGPAAMVSVVATEGSAPRAAGTRMIVAADGQRGTIGGGRLEQIACEQARAILAEPPGAWRIQDYPLGPLLGQCCGGRVRLLVEHLDRQDAEWLHAAQEGVLLATKLTPGKVARGLADHASRPPAARGPWPETVIERIGAARRPLYLFGAGHVGQAIARIVRPLAFTLSWFDARADFAAVEGVTHVPAERLADCASAAPADAAVLILTHDHALDYALTAAALAGAAGFVGLIGSATKRARFIARLTRDGVDAARLICPIGLPGITGKAPEVIAVAVAAQLMLPADVRPGQAAAPLRRMA